MLKSVGKCLISGIMGIIYGFLLIKSQAMVSFSLLQKLPVTVDKFDLTADQFAISLMDKTVFQVAAGGAILGCGIALSGGTPDGVMAQIGAGLPEAVLTAAGAFLGTCLYLLMEQRIVQSLMCLKPSIHSRLDEYIKHKYIHTSLTIATTLGIVVFILESVRPWNLEALLQSQVEEASYFQYVLTVFSRWCQVITFYPQPLRQAPSEEVSWLQYLLQVTQSENNLLRMQSWPPYVCGFLIGLLQVPHVIFLSSTLGSTTGYRTVAAHALLKVYEWRSVIYIQYCPTDIRNWFQVFYLGGAIIGGYLSTTASGAQRTVTGVTYLQCFVGGFLMLFGAQIAGKCFSGHMFSGSGLLMLKSFVAVASIITGGISTAMFLHYLGSS